ncbi:MAG: endopeptidase La [Elusimicrobia bacterium CG08_land_8_20_14_0_20_51_18]|nr:MAG: endopeptidase La [Elusimicrobia bacterium CG08_land_8_20_14_0_20_51_18]
MSHEIKNDMPVKLPVIAIRDIVVFPHMHLPLAVDRPKSVAAIETALKGTRKYVLAVAQRNPHMDDPRVEDLYGVGVLGEVTQSLKLPDSSMRVFISGIKRVKILSLAPEDKDGPLYAQVEYLEDKGEKNSEVMALMRHLMEVFENYVKLTTKISVNSVGIMEQIDDPSKLADTVAANTIFNISERQDVLETPEIKERLEKLVKYLTREIEILDMEQKIQNRVKAQIDKSQKEYYLNEQMKAIQKELHQKDDLAKEIDEWKKKIKGAKMSKEAEQAAEKELARLAKMMPFSPESTVSRNYLDWLVSLPWGVETPDVIDIEKARKILNDEHFGLNKPKERVLEYLAVTKLTKKLKGPILCFVGPPGTGKTSIARSIAHAMDRKFVRMSLGGVRDEAEIRGHRRTYIGSMPGRIMQSLKKAKSKNPVFLMDEVDKMGMDWRGDPAAALLEVLDPEQNSEFADHFIDLPFDISKVMFIATANSLAGIPVSLRDRLEIIEFGGYTHSEKIEIARKYLIPRQFEEHGINQDRAKNITIEDAAIDLVIREYTREAGVRNLEREIANLSRKIARKLVEEKKSAIEIKSENAHEYLGIPRFAYDKVSENAVGVATGLAWTENGGEVLAVEAIDIPGKGNLVLTGKMGDVMKESAQAAFSYVKSLVPAGFKHLSSRDYHVHIPEGAIPKDGPSAGITIATALYSLLSKKAVKGGISMTGEITLTGRVLAIGGLKEKVIASFRENIKTVFFPQANMKDLSEIPGEIREKMRLIPVSCVREVLEKAVEDFKIGGKGGNKKCIAKS